jgi:hypothetical protein
VAALVEHEVREAQHVTRQVAARAAQDRVHARDDLGQVRARAGDLDVGEHPVEDDEVRLEPRESGERGAAGCRLLDLEPS